MAFLVLLPLTLTDFGIVERYWRLQRTKKRSFWQEEEVFNPQRVFFSPNM
jgi:hypothetical protein